MRIGPVIVSTLFFVVEISAESQSDNEKNNEKKDQVGLAPAPPNQSDPKYMLFFKLCFHVSNPHKL